MDLNPAVLLADRLLERDQNAETAAVEEFDSGEIDLQEAMMGLEFCTYLVANLSRVLGREFCQTEHSERVLVRTYLHVIA